MICLIRRCFLGLFLLLVGWSCQNELPDPEGLQKDISVTYVPQEMDNRYIAVLSEKECKDKLVAVQSTTNFPDEKIPWEIIGQFDVAEERIAHIYSNGFLGFSAYLTKEEVEKLDQSPFVLRVEKDVALNYPALNEKSGAKAAYVSPSTLKKGRGDLVPDGVKRVGGPVNYKGKNVVYIFDSGIDLKNKELNVEVSRGFNGVYSGEDSKSLQDLNGHGTHVAGIIAAKMDGVGIAGVAAGAKVVPIKILDKNGNGTYSGVLAALDHIINDGCEGDVVNISLTGPPTTTLETSILKGAKKGIRFVFAAGNNSDDATNYSPGRLNGENLYTVSAMDENDVFAEFSNYGSPPIDWCAPGVSVLSTWINDQYNFRDGTSYAAPHVSAMVLMGGPAKDGLVKNDPDGICDPIAVVKCP
ncbi:S8 family peptidase [Echinicola strongylocentroti]|uniref:S8 family peptidase n=1 Tax=Echinicola strongylocentroti TaxID=1795355 RepID=A0A2Z4IP85_9BACT|nr:S8 family serine peptidase [Echinicola strongylocentroti]AWW32570.1 S8 family peptidase [Echinicola strongylocentroti]